MDSVTLLDLTLSINKQGTIETTTYIKHKNLHLYTPSMSAHPPGCLKGTIFGNLIRYWNQTATALITNHSSKLFQNTYKQEVTI
jgi:hypothetical protein